MQELVEQADTARLVLQFSVGTNARLEVAPKALRQMDYERQVPEEFRFRGSTLSLHFGTRVV